MAFPNFGDEILSISGSLDKDNVAADPPRRLAIRRSARARARVLLLLRAGGARGAPFARFLALSSTRVSRVCALASLTYPVLLRLGLTPEPEMLLMY